MTAAATPDRDGATAPPRPGPPWGAHRPGAVGAALLWASRRTLLGRGATRKLLYRAFRAVHGGPVDTVVFGSRVRLHPAHNVSERKALMRPDRMDPREHRLVAEAMRATGAVFLDVGANAGLYSLGAALHAGPGARIVAIDPNPELLERLAFNIETARSDGLVAAGVAVARLAVAISDRDGTGVLAGGRDEGSRSLERSGDGVAVALRPLAAIAAEQGLSRVDVMKIDVEGHEDKVLPPYLASAPPSLWPRLVVIEHLARASWRIDCIEDALSRGYRVVLTSPNNTVLAHAA